MRGASAALAAALVLGTAAGAYAMLKAGPNVAGPGMNHRLKASSGATGPADIVPYTAFWALRAYSSAQLTGTANAIKLRRASDNLELDIKILPTGEVDTDAAGTHCAATSCFGSVVYDQTGNNACGGLSCDWVQTTAANQPSFIFNCHGTKPCLRTVNSTAIVLQAANIMTPTTPVVSLSIVARRTIGSSSCTHIRANGNNNRLVAPAGANLLQLIAPAGGAINAVAVDGTWQATVGVIAGAASVLNVSGTETTGTVTGNLLTGLPGGVLGAATSTCELMEAGMVSDVALTASQRNALQAGARSAYGLP